MKALYCSHCNAIVGLPRDTSVVGCRCRSTNGDHGPRCRARWVSPEQGIAIFTEVAQFGAERDEDAGTVINPCPHCGTPGVQDGNMRHCRDCGSGWTSPSPVYVPRGRSIPQPKALWFLGIHNALLMDGRTDAWRYARGSLFQTQEAIAIRVRPGGSSDTSYVPLPIFEVGTFMTGPDLQTAWVRHCAEWRP